MIFNLTELLLDGASHAPASKLGISVSSKLEQNGSGRTGDL